MNTARIIVTGVELLNKGHRGFEPVVQELIEGAQRELQIAAYVFTPAATPLFDLFGAAAERGVSVSIVINRVASQHPSVRKWLVEAPSKWHSVRVADFSHAGKRELHAKVCVADRARAVVGSANFTWGGLVSNYEIGIEVDGESAWKLASLVDELMAMSSIDE